MKERYNSLDEFIENHKKELINPKPYRFNGIYHFQGRENYQEGEFFIDENMKLVGRIDDINSKAMHVAKGEITIKDNLINLAFVKIPTGLFASIYYYLGKANVNGIIGDYEGIWTFKDEVINLKIGYKPGIGEAVMVEHPSETSNKATLSLWENINN